MLRCMQRTNIYLSDEEQAALDARAEIERSTRSDVVRTILDRELGLSNVDPELEQAFADLAPMIAERARTLAKADPDLRTS